MFFRLSARTPPFWGRQRGDSRSGEWARRSPQAHSINVLMDNAPGLHFLLSFYHRHVPKRAWMLEHTVLEMGMGASGRWREQADGNGGARVAVDAGDGRFTRV